MRDSDPRRPYDPVEAAQLRAGVDALGIRNRLGRKQWTPPEEFGEGWGFFSSVPPQRTIFVTSWIEEGVEWVHASMSRGGGVLPTYEDLKMLHAAVWPGGYAYQCFVPEADHIDITPNVLHLWGRADGVRGLPDFGRWGII